MPRPTARARSATGALSTCARISAPRLGIAAAGYAAFALAEACGRLAGSTLLARLGQTRVLVSRRRGHPPGMITAALSPVLPLARFGFALAGLGVANAFPTAMARVGILGGPHGVAIASTLGYAGFSSSGRPRSASWPARSASASR